MYRKKTSRLRGGKTFNLWLEKKPTAYRWEKKTINISGQRRTTYGGKKMNSLNLEKDATCSVRRVNIPAGHCNCPCIRLVLSSLFWPSVGCPDPAESYTRSRGSLSGSGGQSSHRCHWSLDDEPATMLLNPTWQFQPAICIKTQICRLEYRIRSISKIEQMLVKTNNPILQLVCTA